MQTIIVDMTPGFRMPTIYYSQGDIGTQFAVDLRSRFGDSLPAGATVTIQATKPSGFGFSEAATSVTNGVAVFTTVAGMTDEAGRFAAELKVEASGITLFTANFYMNGEASTHPEGTIDGSEETVIPELTQLVERVETAASSVLDMTVEAETLAAGSQAAYSYDEDTNTATFGIPQGEAGAGAAGVTASAYSSSSTYAVGDYVIHNSNLYRCTTAITTAEAFTAAHWTQVVLADDVTDLKSDLNLTTNNMLTDVEKIEKKIGWATPESSDYYDYFSYVPVEANTTYILNFTARYVQLFDSSKVKQGSEIANVSSFTPTVDGYAHVTILRTNPSYTNPKMSLSTITEDDVLNYGEHWLNNKVVAQKFRGGMVAEKEYVNLFDSSSSEVGILQANGTVGPTATNYKTTGYVPVKAGTKYVIANFRTFLKFDSTHTIISGSWIDELTYDYEYTPSADGYIRWSYLATWESTQELNSYRNTDGYKIKEGIELSNLMKKQVETLIQNGGGNVLAGKKWWACGDSFTEWTTESYTPSDAPNVTGLSSYKTYPYWIGKRNPSLTVYNYAVSGQTMATPSSGDFTNAFSNSLYQSIPSDVDYITLYFGINDSHHRPGSSGGDGEDNTGEIPLGTINDATINTFYGAWNVVLEYLITNYPWAKIGIIITNGAETEDYPNAEIALAKKWGVPYLDLNGDYKLPLMLRSNGKTDVCATAVNIRKSQQWTDPSSNGHPNVNAHKFESTFIENFLRSI